ncbi:MAG TPA: aminotransferase class III-fold pyridoxal phosphate-dependent enzyme, partial [Candidatus Krumholzibacteriaceae bacterium]|nr:aminotransferase class III-fold pyridoxal phosphate-dependent enzyme [Candidatus Krumholzibacteriaceae bacterium]
MTADYEKKRTKSKRLYARAKKVLPAGVSYFIRYFEPYPFYVSHARGSKIHDVDSNTYIDFWMGHYTHILGHNPTAIRRAVQKQLEKGIHLGVCHELEVALAEQVVKMVPSAKMVRFTNSGTEASMYATRLARAHTGKDKVVKFEGGWHGGYDALQVAVKPPFDIPETSGLPEEVARNTIVAPFNDIETTRRKTKNEEIAAFIIEPVLGSGGGIPAEKEFLQELRELSREKDALLVFDEVITGFRLSPGGAQKFYGVIPNLTILGKILGGGFPVGAVVGKREIMERLDATVYERPQLCFHGGTFSANPITMIAGLTMLKQLEDGTIIRQLNKRGTRLRQQLREIFENNHVDVQVTGEGSLFLVH